MIEFLHLPSTWLALGQIIAIDIMLGADNAVVIAMACRNLPRHLRRKAVISGVAGAILLRIVMLFFAMQLLALPGLRVVGAILLLWVGIKLMKAEEDHYDSIKGTVLLLSAIKTIVIADAVMSLDNVLAIAGAAGGDMFIVSLGVLISIPIIVWGSGFVLDFIERFPQVILFGAGLLGWIAGGMASSDILVQPSINTDKTLYYVASSIGAVLVVCVGYFYGRIRPKADQEECPPL
ncbi:YjbE family integral membrane protein [Pseudomonas laurylsulfativorans]|uniref:TerC family protein n=1 Tax=Pseudomonas laurylsulfativorans TaxID=1943631 RepID=UPI0020A14364|nr:TerC family protein [Pseudomonas laurylsulfativorans]MCP1415954.1 YjbE family integral membrane protein [Pseudomonas laurylsulfativorans]